MRRIYQEQGELAARFPDIVKLDDGRLMAVWYSAPGHLGPIGTIQLSYGSADGHSWSEPILALPPGTMATLDTRDPKLGTMRDGGVVLTFFLPPDEDHSEFRVFGAVWRPGRTHFAEPEELTAPDLPSDVAAHGFASHGGALALAGNQLLIPVYTSELPGGSYFLRATWQPEDTPSLLVTGSQLILANGEPRGRVYLEPSFALVGETVVCAVRVEQGEPGAPYRGRTYAPVAIARWDADADEPVVTSQNFGGVMASSHHLLPTADGQILFTYGDRSIPGRPTLGMMIKDPAAEWIEGKVVPIYDSGFHDQANPSSVEIAPGTFLTLGYDARNKSDSPSGGTLWAIETNTTDY